jgi:hypothetical protein
VGGWRAGDRLVFLEDRIHCFSKFSKEFISQNLKKHAFGEFGAKVLGENSSEPGH